MSPTATILTYRGESFTKVKYKKKTLFIDFEATQTKFDYRMCQKLSVNVHRCFVDVLLSGCQWLL